MNNDPMYIGKKYGRLTVIGFTKAPREWLWHCRCECGKEKDLRPSEVKSGKIMSCGCLHNQLAKERATKFKNSVACNKRLYMIYNNMKRRCYKANEPRYRDYGGRGIKICDEWLNSVDGFDNFADWALSHGYNESMTIDRENVDGDYCPENCRWLTLKQQNMNKRTTVYVTYRGEKWKLKDLCDAKGLKYDTIHGRIHDKGWDAEAAIDTPVETGKSEFTVLCESHGLNPATVRSRVKKLGWSLERALNTPSIGRGANKASYSKTPIDTAPHICYNDM